jgi:hypothetical protein
VARLIGFAGVSRQVPTAHTGGNHEISNGGENWIAYKTRYPNPHRSVGSDSFLWYSFETGPVHVIVLCSYADFTNGSLQAQFLRKDLASVDRSRTPFLLAMWHTPWYTSNHHHPMSEGAEMRASMEVGATRPTEIHLRQACSCSVLCGPSGGGGGRHDG